MTPSAANPLAALAERFLFNERFLDQLTADFGEHDWFARHGESNHAQWLLGHLACTRRWALRELGAGASEEPWEKHFGQGCRPGPEGDDIAPAMLREALLKNGEMLRRFLGTRSAEQAEAPFLPFPDGSRTVAAGAHFLHFHETYHLGQIGLLRRLQGLPGLI